LVLPPVEEGHEELEMSLVRGDGAEHGLSREDTGSDHANPNKVMFRERFGYGYEDRQGLIAIEYGYECMQRL